MVDVRHIYYTMLCCSEVLLRLHVNVVEPYDLYSWMVILVGTVHTMGFFVLLFDYLSPRGTDRYSRNIWNG